MPRWLKFAGAVVLVGLLIGAGLVGWTYRAVAGSTPLLDGETEVVGVIAAHGPPFFAEVR